MAISQVYSKKQNPWPRKQKNQIENVNILFQCRRCNFVHHDIMAHYMEEHPDYAAVIQCRHEDCLQQEPLFQTVAAYRLHCVTKLHIWQNAVLVEF